MGRCSQTLALASCVWLLTGALHAQDGSVDPRQGLDPRSTATDPRQAADPRKGADPRAADVKAQNAARADRLTGPALFDDLFERSEFASLAQAISAQPWQLLAYLDDLCEQWLALVESSALATPAGVERAQDLRAQIERFSQMGDQVLGDTTFSSWTTGVLTWTPEQIDSYRRGQQLYTEALTLFATAGRADETLRALTPLRQAQDLLTPLGLTWEASMTSTLIGRVQMANRELSAAEQTMSDALRLGRAIRDLDAVWNGLSIHYEAAINAAQYDRAQDLLKEQYRIALETGDQASAQDVVARMTKLLDFRKATGF